ncbi:hypothetical protein GKQ38_05420 [Candidatus Nanohaloarchaea archaeon]|nr:hypothetical protein GKQ38_05420 [Candidatus Nanohaloarchaea archaeon]
MKIHVNGVRNLIETKARSAGRKLYSILLQEHENESPLFDPLENTSLLTPDVDGEGYWVGGPSPFYDEEKDELYIYYRLRDPYRRGWKSVIAKTQDGEELEEVKELTAEEFEAHSLEGGALQKKDGEYILYISYHEKSSGQWKIDRTKSDTVEGLKADNREEMDLTTGFTHVKDPVVDGDDIIVHTASKNFLDHGNFRVENPSTDPEVEKIEFADESSSGRITSTLELRDQKYFFYDWLPSIIFTGEEKTKIGKAEEGEIEDLMPGRKAIGSASGTKSLRYVKAVEVDEEIWFYYEKSMPGKGHELCIYKMDKASVTDKLEELDSREILSGPSGI